MFCPLGQSRKLNGYFPFKRQTTVESSAENVSIASISTSKTGSMHRLCVCECVRARVCVNDLRSKASFYASQWEK